MRNFTRTIKREIVSSPPENACCGIAACAAFLRTSGSIVSSREGLGFEIVTENDDIAEYFISVLENLYGVKMQLEEAVLDPKCSRDKLTFCYRGNQAERILEELGVISRMDGSYAIDFSISPYLVENDCCGLAFIKGAFLGGGSCTLPARSGGATGYHLEFVFSSETLAEDFCELLERYDILSKLITRGEKSVVYLNNRDALSDFFSLIGADGALGRLNDVSSAREESNNENRVSNCFASNTDRTAQASADQIIALKKIEEGPGLESLDLPLYELARARLENPMESMRALGEKLGISKSCLSHRMRRLMEISREIED